MGCGPSGTVVERAVRWVQEGPDQFTTSEIAAGIGCQTASNRLKGALATMAALGQLKHVHRGQWRRAAPETNWRGRVVEAVRGLCALSSPRTDPHMPGKRQAAQNAIEKLLPLSGMSLLLDSGSQIACCAEVLADGLSQPSAPRRRQFRRPTVLTNNCLAFLELLPARVAGDLADLIAIGGEYVSDLGAHVPPASGPAWQIIEGGLAPVVLMSVAALTPRGLYSHHAQQADWKRRLIQSATSVYIVADSSKLLSDMPPNESRGGIFVGEQQHTELWERMLTVPGPNLHVVIGADPDHELDAGQLETGRWLQAKLGDRFSMHPAGKL